MALTRRHHDGRGEKVWVCVPLACNCQTWGFSCKGSFAGIFAVSPPAKQTNALEKCDGREAERDKVNDCTAHAEGLVV